MVGVKGRHEARKRVCHRANTFQRAAPEFHDRVSGQQHVGTQPWGLPVLGPCQWHRPYRARSRSNRARTSVDGGARGTPSPVDGTFSVGAQWLAGAEWRWAKRRAAEGGTRWCLTEAIEGLRQVSSYTRRPATSFLCVSTHINTRYVYTGTTPAFVAVFALSGSLRPPFCYLLLRCSFLCLFLSSLCSVFLPKYFCGPDSSERPLSFLPIFPVNDSHSTTRAVVSC